MKVEEPSAGGAMGVGVQRKNPHPASDQTYQVRPNADTIPCPGLVALYNHGVLRPDSDGKVTNEHLNDALASVGMSWGVRQWLQHVADRTDQVKHSFNLFKLRDSNLDHPGSSGIRDPTVDPDKLPELLRFGENGRLSEKHFAMAASHYHKHGGERDPALVGTAILNTEFTALLLVFGRVDEKGNRYVTFDDLRRLYVEGRFPEGWTPPDKDAVSVGRVMGMYVRLALRRTWEALKGVFGGRGAR